MTLKNTMAGTVQASSRFWAERNQREQRILLGGLAAILAALVYLLLISPAQDGISRYNRSLPEMRQQVAQLQALVREAAALPQGDAATAPPSAPLTKEGLEAALQRRGLKPESVSVSGDIVRVQFSAAPFSNLMEWMSEARTAFQLSVTEANVTAKPSPDIVDASLTLRQQKGQ
jgi:general secretion pathway protein M